MPSYEPLHDLMKGIVAAWAANVTLENAISGPWQGERPPDEQANPAVGTAYPYCLISGSAAMTRLSCGREYWDHEITFRVYQTTEKLAADAAALISAVYDSDSLSLTLDNGTLISHRPRRRRYVEADKMVWFCEMPYYFQTSRPRVT